MLFRSSVGSLFLVFVIVTIVAIGWGGREELPAPNLVAAPVPLDPYTLRAAQEGDAEAQFRMAKTLLLDVVRGRENSAEAVRWLQSAAEKDSSGAMVHLGKLYRSGFGVLQDYDLAAKWIRTAAERGDADGMLELGRLYRDGVGFPRDPVRAYVWLNRAAAAQHLEAVRDRDDVARGLSADQLKEAQALSTVVEASSAMARSGKDSKK